jgi:hypothetical protein
VPDGVDVAAGERLLLELVDHVAVLGVDHDHHARVAGELKDLEEVLVRAEQRRALVGHEELHRGHAVAGSV